MTGPDKMPPVLSKESLEGHEASRLTCCALCICERGKKASRPVSDSDEALIRKKVNSNYSRQDLRYATGLCTPCHISLYKENSKIYVSEKFGEKVKRSPDGCQCTLCFRAALKGGPWMIFCRKYSDKINKPGRPTRAPGWDKNRVAARARGPANAPGPAPRHAPGPAHRDDPIPGPAPRDDPGRAPRDDPGPAPRDDPGPTPHVGRGHGPDLAPEQAPEEMEPAPGLDPGPALTVHERNERRGWSGPGKPNRLCPNCLTEVI